MHRRLSCLLFVLVLSLLAPRVASAQAWFGGGLDGGAATGAFRKYASGIAGLHVDGGWLPPLVPLRLGARVGWLSYGVPGALPPLPSMSLPSSDVPQSLGGGILSGDVLLRLEPHGQLIEPFLEGVLGGTLFSQTIDSSHRERNGDRTTTSDTTFLDQGAVHFGLGGGIAVAPSAAHNSELELGLKWLIGSETHVAGPTSITHDWPPTRSTTNMLLVSVSGAFLVF